MGFFWVSNSFLWNIGSEHHIKEKFELFLVSNSFLHGSSVPYPISMADFYRSSISNAISKKNSCSTRFFNSVFTDYQIRTPVPISSSVYSYSYSYFLLVLVFGRAVRVRVWSSRRLERYEYKVRVRRGC